ncbi:hypothetical protein ABK040_003424 [Willaertia magna]
MATYEFPSVSVLDKNTFANNDKVNVKHIHLDLTVDFEKQAIFGFADLTCHVLINNPNVLILDSRNLVISEVKLLKKNNEANEQTLPFKVFDRKEVEENGFPEVFGTPLAVTVESLNLQEGNEVVVRVSYQTTKQSEAIQWLNPEQTLGKKHPYLFTQCQAIHCRSFCPCQDTPSSKITYSSVVRVDKPLVAVMSALKRKEGSDEKYNIFEFEQPIPIPSYLIALGVGALKSIEVGKRSTLYCEEEVLQKGAFEFSETEDFIAAAEQFLPSYAWTRYDLLLMAASYPYGGMENSNMTFLTPTLLAGDKSLANVVAHEIAHSWSGNLVTNRNWEHFFLNEGFTVFIERRILARMLGEEFAKFHAQIGYTSLVSSVKHYEELNLPQFTKMIPNLDKIDPDDAFSSVPYEKGFNFLYYLATTIVGDMTRFESFLKHYFTVFANQTVTSEDMKKCFLEFFADVEKVKEIDWDTWFYGEGLGPITNNFDNTLSTSAVELADRWIKKSGPFERDDIKGWTSHHICYFLDRLLESETEISIEQLDKTYDFSSNTNSEIMHRWQMLALKWKYEPIKPFVVKFITSQGRMKYVRTLYSNLFKVDPELAVKTFKEHEGFYHSIARKMIAKDLKLEK